MEYFDHKTNSVNRAWTVAKWVGYAEPYTAETKAIADRVRTAIKAMPFLVEKYLEMDIPGGDSVANWGH